MALCLVFATTAAAADAGRRVRVPAQPLEASLKAVAYQTNVNVLFTPAALGRLRGPPLDGRYTAEQAVRLLIADTPLKVVRQGDSLLVIAVETAPRRPRQTRVAADKPQTGGSAPSVTAPAPTALEEVIVTARRREEQVQDVPISVIAFSGEQLARRSIGKMGELTTGVPGVFVGPGSSRGNNSPVFAIRGQLNRDPAPTADPSIGIYFAEAPWARMMGANAAFFDLQSVAAMKGPQGTLFGRNSTGGAILITPNPPSDTFGGYAKAAAGSFRLFEAEGVLNAPLGDTLSLRLAGRHQRRDGYMHAVNTGLVSADLHNQSLRGSLRWEPTDRFASTLIATYYRTDTNGDGRRLYGVAPGPPSAGAAAAFPRYVAALARMQALGKYDYITGFSPAVAATPVLGVPSVFLTKPQATAQAWSVQNTSTYGLGSFGALGDLTLRNIVGYREVDDLSTLETAPVDFLNIQTTSTSHIKQISEELQLQGKTDRASYILGLFYFQERADETNRTYAAVPITNLGQGIVRNTAYSAFAHLDYALSSTPGHGFGISGGVRFNHDQRRLRSMSRRRTTPGPSANPLYTCTLQPEAPVNDGSLCDISFAVESSEPTWDLGLNYKFSPENMIYASWSRGYRTGGFNFSATSREAVGPYLPEIVYNHEVGSKNDFRIGNLKGRLNLAAFYTDYKNIQRTLNIVNSVGQFSNQTINAARAKIKGLEADLTIKPSRNLDFLISYAYLRPEYKKFVDQFLDPTDGIIYPVDVSDSEFVLVSRHSLSAAATYTFPVDDRYGELSLTANYYYRTKFYTTSDVNTATCRPPGDPNPDALYANCYNRLGVVPGYGLLNMRLDWRRLMGSRVDAALFVTNVTNNYYYQSATNAMNALGILAGEPGPPRMFGIELRAPFGS